MLRPGGYATITDPDAPLKEMDTFSCGHCNKVTHVKPFQDPSSIGGLCKVCMKLICETCCSGPCDPLEEKLKRWEDQSRFRREMIGR